MTSQYCMMIERYGPKGEQNNYLDTLITYLHTSVEKVETVCALQNNNNNN